MTYCLLLLPSVPGSRFFYPFAIVHNGRSVEYGRILYVQIKNGAWIMVTRSMDMRHGHSISRQEAKTSSSPCPLASPLSPRPDHRQYSFSGAMKRKRVSVHLLRNSRRLSRQTDRHRGRTDTQDTRHGHTNGHWLFVTGGVKPSSTISRHTERERVCVWACAPCSMVIPAAE